MSDNKEIKEDVNELEESLRKAQEEVANDPNARITIPMDEVDLTLLEDGEFLLPHEFDSM